MRPSHQNQIFTLSISEAWSSPPPAKGPVKFTLVIQKACLKADNTELSKTLGGLARISWEEAWSVLVTFVTPVLSVVSDT